MKLAGWYIRVGYKLNPQITGGLSEEEHLERFRLLMSEIDTVLADEFKREKGGEVKNEDLEFCWIRRNSRRI
jgi:hypothetical protein